MRVGRDGEGTGGMPRLAGAGPSSQSGAGSEAGRGSYAGRGSDAGVRRPFSRAVTWPLRLGPASDGLAPATPFRRLVEVHLLSTAGDAMVAIALAGSVFFSVSLTAARGRTAIGLVCTLLPFLVVGPFLGRVIDATPGGRRAMLSLASLGRAFGCVLMAQWVHGLAFFPAAFLTLVCSKAYLISRAAILPGMVDHPDHLVPANAKLAVSSAASSLVAGGIGAAILRLAGTSAVLYLDAVVLVVCAAMAARLRPARPGAVVGTSRSGGSRSGLTSSATGHTSATGHASAATGHASAATGVASGGLEAPASHLPPGGVGVVAVTMASMRASAGLMSALVVFGFRREGAPLYWYGLVGVASVLGNLGGAVLAPLVRQHAREERIVPACALVIGVVGLAVLQLPEAHHRPAALILAATVTLLAAVSKLAFDALVQRDAPPSRRGRSFARLEALFQFVWVMAALLPVGLVMPLPAGFAVVAALTLAGVVVAWQGLRRARVGRLPAWWPGVPDARDDPQPIRAGYYGPPTTPMSGWGTPAEGDDGEGRPAKSRRAFR